MEQISFKEEIINLKEILGGYGITFIAVPGTSKSVMKIQEDPRIIHFSGHCSFNNNKSTFYFHSKYGEAVEYD